MSESESESASERRLRVEVTCVPENAFGEPRVELSPSGRFRLTVRTHRTGPSSWAYSRGVVERVADGTVVCDVARNFDQFHHTFVTKAGDEWLIAGRSYMSQTIVNLDRAEEHEPEGDPYVSNAFCWASCFLSRDEQTLAVDGCFWACPYEYRFYDFTNPQGGWALLPIDPEGCVEVESEKPPRWREDGSFECYAVRGGQLVGRTVLRREGARMVVVERFVEPAEQARRDETERAAATEDAWRERFLAEDELRGVMMAEVTRLELPNDGYVSWGRREGARLVGKFFRRKDPKASADLEWGAENPTIPITVQLYDDQGKRTDSIVFERSGAGMRAALARIAAAFAPRA